MLGIVLMRPDKIPTTIYFVRHGHVRNPNDVYYGRLPGFPLSEEGLHQAAASRDALAGIPIAAIYSSPQLRARQTARVILSAHEGLALNISELLDEVYSPFDGYPHSKMEERNWDIYSGVDRKYEQPVDVLRRIKQFIAEACKEYPGQHIVAVTHGDNVAFIKLWNQGITY